MNGMSCMLTSDDPYFFMSGYSALLFLLCLCPTEGKETCFQDKQVLGFSPVARLNVMEEVAVSTMKTKQPKEMGTLNLVVSFAIFQKRNKVQWNSI